MTTNKLVATLAGELFNLRVQAYPRYGSEKKGLPTTYYLTIADEPIHQHGELETVDMVAIYDVAAFRQGDRCRPGRRRDALRRQRDHGAEAVWAALPAEARAEILARRISVWSLDTAGLARAMRHGRPGGSHAGRGPGRRLPPRVAVRGRAGLDRDALLAAVGTAWDASSASEGAARGGGQPAGDQRRVRRRAERHRGDRGGPRGLRATPLLEAIR